MNDDDYDNFVDAIDRTCKVIRKPAIEEDDVLDAWFEVLRKYDFKQVTDALSALCVHPQSSYGITTALVVECMGIKEERELTWKGIIALARKPDHLASPISVLARMHIKTFNLNEKQDRELHYLAQEFLDDLPEIKARALAGNYSEHEVSVMIERGVRPTASFMAGMPEYKALGSNDPLKLTFEKAKRSDYYQVVKDRNDSARQNGLPINEAGQKKVISELKNLLSENEPDQSAIDSDQSEFDRLMNKAVE